MNILLAAPYGGVSGGISRWTSHIETYYMGLRQKILKMEILPMGRSTFVNINSPLLYRLFFAIKDYSSILKNFKFALNHNQYDIIHLTSSGSLSLFKDVYMLHLAKAKGCKTIIHFHYGRIPDLFKNKNWEYHMLKKVIALSDTVIVIDKLTYDVLQQAGYRNIVYLPNPLSPEVESIVENNNSLKRDRHTLVFVGHVVKTKGIFELIEACKEVHNIKLKLVGFITTKMKMDLKEFAGPGSSSWLEIKGELDYENTIKEMLTAGIFVLPTYTEGFPNVILESMACGCPIVTTNVGAIPEMLDIANGNRYGICIPPKDVDRLRAALLKMLNDKEYADACGDNAKIRVRNEYSMPIIWNKLVECWMSVYSKKSK